MTHRWILFRKRFTRLEGYTYNRFLQAALTEGTSTSWALIYASFNGISMLASTLSPSFPIIIVLECYSVSGFPISSWSHYGRSMWNFFYFEVHSTCKKKRFIAGMMTGRKRLSRKKSTDKTRTLTAGRDVSRFPLVKVHRSITLVCCCSRVGKMDQGKGGKLNFPKARKWILRKKPK